MQRSNQILDNASVVVSAGSFNLVGNNETVFGVQLAGGSITGTTGVLTSTTAFDLRSGTVSAILNGTAGLSKTTAGTVTLSGVNTYTGTTSIAAGTLRMGVAGALVQGSAVAVNLGAMFDLNGFNQNIGSLSNGANGGGIVSLGAATLTTGNNDVSTTFSGTITGTGGLTKVGTGTFSLNGENTYTGTTAVNEGELLLNGSLSGPVTVNNGSEFAIGGTGRLILGNGVIAVTANNGDTVTNVGVLMVGDGSTGVRAITNNTITNFNTITGGATGSVGVELAGAGNTFTNAAGATIIAETAILLSNPAGNNTVINYGTLIGTGGQAIRFTGNGTVSLTNLGTINGSVGLGGGDDTFTLVTGIPVAGLIDGGGGNNTLRLVGTQTDTLDLGSVTNFSTLLKRGGGMWTFTGTGSFQSGTIIEAGKVYVQGNLISNVTVQNEAFLGGNGFITGNLRNFGIVSPGNSPGKITVQGNFTQGRSGTLVIEVAGKKDGQFDVLEVTGEAHLDGRLRVERVGKGPRLKVGDRLAFLTAAGGVEGEFSEISNGLQTDTMVRPGVVYEENAVVLTGVQSSYVDFARSQQLSPNQRAVAKVVDSVAFGRQDTEEKMVDHLNSQPLAKIPGELNKVAGEELASAYRVGVALANVQHQNLQRRMDDLRLSGRRPPRNPAENSYGSAGVVAGFETPKEVLPQESKDRWGTFFTGTGQVTKVGRTENAHSYDLQTGGLTVGVDYSVTPNFTIGLTFGYANTSANLPGSGNLSVNGGKLAAYGTYFTKGFHADGILSAGLNSYDTRREGLNGSARGRTDGTEWSALAGVGYDWGDESFTIGPLATVQYTWVGLNEFTERGSLAPLNVPDQHATSLRSTLGFKSAFDWEVGRFILRPEIRAAWMHEYGDRSLSLDSSLASGAGGLFTVYDSEVGRDSFVLGAGLSMIWSPKTLLYLFYDGQLGQKEYQSHNLSGGLRMTF